MPEHVQVTDLLANNLTFASMDGQKNMVCNNDLNQCFFAKIPEEQTEENDGENL